MGQAPALAATINVGGTCTLVRAITAANTDAATGGCPAGSGADTLTLQNSSVHTLTRANNSTYGPTGLPVVSSVITIEGNGSTIRRDPADPDLFRIFAVNSAGDLTLNETTVSGGVAADFSFPHGGGIANIGGALTLENSTVSGNSARGGGGVFNNRHTRYGYPYYYYSFGTLTLTNSTVSGNSAYHGGGLDNGSYGSTVTLTNSTVSDNSAVSTGGGVNNAGGTATLTNSTVSGNGAGGGGVNNAYGTLTLTNSTVSGNSAGSSGGGVSVNSSTLTLTNSTVSGNTAPVGAEVHYSNYFGGTLTDNFNLFGHSGLSNAEAFSNFTPGASDITATSDGTTPTALANILAPLADNGGLTETHALVAGSPAIDAVGSGCPPPATDQRGVARPQGLACDIGSFEVMPAPAPDLAVSKTDSPDPVVVSDNLTYTVTVNNAGQGEATGVILTDTLPASVDLVSVRPKDRCAEWGGVITCELGTLASGERARVQIVVMPTATGRITNRVAVTSAETDENPKNNTDRERTTVTKLLCNGRVPTLVGTPGNNTLTGTSGRDIIHGLGGRDTIKGRSGKDVLCGGEGNDTLFGEDGADALNGGAGTDTCNGGSGSDTGTNCETVTSIP